METLIEQLLNRTHVGRKELARERLIVDVTEQIWQAMQERKISKADLARALGTSKANVTQLLSGQRNMTLATLADICAAIGCDPTVVLTGGAMARRERSGDTRQAVCIPDSVARLNVTSASVNCQHPSAIFTVLP